MSIDEAQGYLAGDSNNGHSLEVAFALLTPGWILGTLEELFFLVVIRIKTGQCLRSINFIKPIQYC